MHSIDASDKSETSKVTMAIEIDKAMLKSSKGACNEFVVALENWNKERIDEERNQQRKYIIDKMERVKRQCNEKNKISFM